MPELFCWVCFRVQLFDEIESDVYRCRTCTTVRDLTDPDDSIGKDGE